VKKKGIVGKKRGKRVGKRIYNREGEEWIM